MMVFSFFSGKLQLSLCDAGSSGDSDFSGDSDSSGFSRLRS